MWELSTLGQTARERALPLPQPENTLAKRAQTGNRSTPSTRLLQDKLKQNTACFFDISPFVGCLLVQKAQKLADLAQFVAIYKNISKTVF